MSMVITFETPLRSGKVKRNCKRMGFVHSGKRVDNKNSSFVSRRGH